MKESAHTEIRRVIIETRRKKSDITSLEINDVLIQTMSHDIKKLLEEMPHLKVLNLTECKLKSLQNLPYLPQLQQIDLTSNSLSSQELRYLKKYQKLKIINLGNNRIEDLSFLTHFAHIPELQELQLYENPVSELPAYRQCIFDKIPTLKYLDGTDKYGRSMEDEEEQDMILEEDEDQSDGWQNQFQKLEENQDMLRQQMNFESQFGEDLDQDMNGSDAEEKKQAPLKKKRGPKKGYKRGSKKTTPNFS